MPFDGSGNFSRDYNWQDDRDNGIHILAARMDGEFDNFAAGMNVVFFRNGLVPMSGNLNMGQNYLIGLGAGSVGSLALKFADDPNSGLFLNGINKPTLVAGGNARLEANTTGVAITGNTANSGTFNSVGAITQNGQQVWHSGNLTPGDYMPKAGGTFTGGVTFDAGAVIRKSSGPYLVDIFNQSVSTADYAAVRFQQGGGAGAPTGLLTTGGSTAPTYGGYFALATQSNHPIAFATNDTVRMTVAAGGTVNIIGSLTRGGNAVWDAGNFNPALYATFAGANNFTNLNRFSAATDEKVRLYGSTQPFISVYDATQTTRWGYLGLTATTAQLSADNAAGSIQLLIGGATRGQITNAVANFQGTLQQAGSAVWHAGNFDPTLKANLASPTFTGTVGVTGTQTIFNNATGNYATWQYNGTSIGDIGAANQVYSGGSTADFGVSSRAGNLVLGQNNTARATLTSAGMTLVGEITKSGAGQFLRHTASGLSGAVSRGTAAPSGGSDGDIYLQYS